MDDAQANHPGPSPNGLGEDGAANQILTISTMHDTSNQVFSEDAQSMLQQVAQDATSQIDEHVSTPVRQHDQLPISQAGADSNMTHQHSTRSGDDIDAQGSQDDGHLDVSSVQANGPEPLLPDYHHLHQPDSTISLDLAQVNEALLLNTDDPALEAATSVIESEAPRIQAFAKLEFDDGEFYMNTYSVELGRDVRAARQAYERDLQAGAKLRKQSSSSANLSHSSSKVRQENGEHLTGSVMSESGGVVRLDPSDRGDDEVKQRRHKKSKSATSSSQQLSRKSSMNLPGTRTDYQSLAMASLRDPTADEEIVVPAHRNMPSPESCPLVPIHPPTATDGAPSSHKSISRKHVRIAFNFEKHLFEVIVLGRNGAFVDEEWYPEGDVQPLRSGSLIQIGGVGIRFLLPDVAPGETGAENHLNSDPVSFDMDYASGGYGDVEGSSDAERDDDDKDDVHSDNAGDDSNDIGSAENEEEEEEESDESEEEPRGRQRPRLMKPTPANRPVRAQKSIQGKEATKTREPPKAKAKAKPKIKSVANSKEAPKPEPVTPPPKRKGPGRPPKNGIISKREQALLAREAKEAAKATAQGKSKDTPASGRGKGKSVPMPIEAKPEKERNNLQPNGKRKYKKRKTKAELEAGLEAGEQQGVRESTEHTDAVPPEQNAAPPPKPPKPMKPPKPPRSPSPVFDEASLTPEQLAKPQSSYVILIHEALSNSTTGQMSLPQIYRAIERKYPFYKLRVQTTGWQSSVRHNLSQHPAFQKITRDGKGWMWGLVPEISIEKEKKRRMSPPQMAAQGYYPGPQIVQPPYNSYPGMPGSIAYPYGPYSGPPVGQIPYHPPAHYPPPLSSSAPVLPAALANAQVDNASTYQSPYATASSQTKPESSLPQQHPVGTSGQQIPADPPIIAENGTSLKQPSSEQQLLTPSLHRPPSNVNHSPRLADHTPEFQSVIHKFKSYLLTSMADKPNAEAIIDSAINGVLNTSDQKNESSPAPPSDNVDGDASGQRGNDVGEKAIQSILRAMLDNLRKKVEAGSGGAASGPSRGASSTPTFTEILNGVGEGASVGTPAPTQPQPQTQTQGMMEQQQQQQQQQRSEPDIPPPDPQQADTVAMDGMPDGGEVERSEGRTGEKEKLDKPDESTALVRSMQTGKRPLEEDGGEDGAMDARQMRAAKRVAT
ncbi:MAG: hypothetical protein Q9228_002840 [Teloschistes exilis]